MPGPGGSGDDRRSRCRSRASGTTDWDVKGALVKGSKMTTTITGTFTIPGVGGAMEMNGTTIVNARRVSLDATARSVRPSIDFSPTIPTWPTSVRSLLSGPARASPRASPRFPTTS